MSEAESTMGADTKELRAASHYCERHQKSSWIFKSQGRVKRNVRPSVGLGKLGRHHAAQNLHYVGHFGGLFP